MVAFDADWDLWANSPERSDAFKAAKAMVDEDEWESNEDRSEAFKCALMIAAQDEWESSLDRSELLLQAKLLALQDEWEQSPKRSIAFLEAKLLVLEDQWEQSPERSLSFQSAKLEVEEEIWESSPMHSDAFAAAKLLEEEEEWEALPEHSEAFAAAKLLEEEEEWETDVANRSEAFLAAKLLVEEDQWELEECRSPVFKFAREAAIKAESDDAAHASDSSRDTVPSNPSPHTDGSYVLVTHTEVESYAVGLAKEALGNVISGISSLLRVMWSGRLKTAATPEHSAAGSLAPSPLVLPGYKTPDQAPKVPFAMLSPTTVDDMSHYSPMAMPHLSLDHGA